MENNTSFLSQLNRWLRESIMVKLTSIAILMLLLLIPQAWVQSIMEERQHRAKEAVTGVSNEWSGDQRVTGPVLVLPYSKTVTMKTVLPGGKEQVENVVQKENAYFLAEGLNIKSKLVPEILHRGIFDVVVYRSEIEMNGSFAKPDLQALAIKPEDVLWNEAYLVNGISDLRGIGEIPEIAFNNEAYKSEPGTTSEEGLFARNITTKIKLSPTDSLSDFRMKLSLKGSSSLHFFPMGRASDVTMEGDWGNPSFDGYYLPENREIDEAHFSARWKILGFNRPFPQQWAGATPAIEETGFGVNLLVPVDQYQKSIRTAKYGILIIMLTFISLFLIELICKIRIHPFQYILIGAALIVYYTLLLSISEHIGFNTSYTLASIATIILITIYSRSFFAKWKVSGLLSLLLTIFYAYIFTITQQQDYALLLGSIGLFIIISVLMYVSRRISWYNKPEEKQTEG